MWVRTSRCCPGGSASGEGWRCLDQLERMPPIVLQEMEAVTARTQDQPGESSIRWPASGMMMALTVREEDEARVRATPPEQRKPSMSLRLEQVAIPEPGPGEVLIAVMAAGINYNNVWSALFEPASPFRYIKHFASLRQRNRSHLQPFAILGSDAAGIVAAVGPGVENCRPGDHVCIHPGVVDDTDPESHEDDVMASSGRAWGFETNYGAFAEYTLVRASQIMSKPAHLTWEEAASLPLVNSTVYRMLISPNGARMRMGDRVLIWGGTGGLGLIACQYVLRAGGVPVPVVSNAERADLLRRLGISTVIDRQAIRMSLWTKSGEPDERGVARLRAHIRDRTASPEVDIAFEHPGQETFWASVALVRRGGKIVTCGSTSGHEHRYDNRRLWMHVKSIIGSHGANYHEATLANRLVEDGFIQPILTRVERLEDGALAIDQIHANAHIGKSALLVQAERPGLGVTDPARRARHGTDRFLELIGSAIRPAA